MFMSSVVLVALRFKQIASIHVNALQNGASVRWPAAYWLHAPQTMGSTGQWVSGSNWSFFGLVTSMGHPWPIKVIRLTQCITVIITSRRTCCFPKSVEALSVVLEAYKNEKALRGDANTARWL